MLRATLGSAVKIQLKRKSAGAEGVQNVPKSLPSRLDPSTSSISLHFYFAPLPLVFPMGDAPGFVTCKCQESVTVAAGPAEAQHHR